MSRTHAETGKVLIEVDEEHFGTHGVDPSRGKVHDDDHLYTLEQGKREQRFEVVTSLMRVMMRYK